MNWFNNFFFIYFPYISFIVFIIGTIYRYFYIQHSYSSLSSQFLERKNLFFASVPFHFGILFLLMAHFLAFLFPEFVIGFLRTPSNLIIFETIGLIFGLSVFFGVIIMLIRRYSNSRLLVVTTKMDLFVELLLLIQSFLGCYIAIFYRWGSVWFASSLTPYLISLFKLHPSADIIFSMNIVIKTHVFLAFLIFFIFPFSRLVHFLVAPFHYITRAFQVVRWNIDNKNIRNISTKWTHTRPKNN